jgi:proliferating cell nuclear antigen
MLYIKTVQAHIISLINEALRNIIYEVNFDFSPEGISIKAANPSGAQLVHLFLDSDKFEKFECKKAVSVGIDMANFSKILKTATKQEILTFKMTDMDSSTLQISIANELTKITKNFEMKLIDIDDQPKTEAPVYSKTESFVIHIQTSKFKNICKGLNALTNEVEITCINNEIKFECVDILRGNNMKADQTIDLTEDTSYCFVTNRCDSIFRGVYSLASLTQFTRFSNLCTHVELTLQNDSPIAISYACGPLGYIKLYLCQYN